jgi:pyruvate dehydrogenase E2 component (dihydrolipoamide acetyltransferase)
MGKLLEIKIPDIGDFKDVPVIEVMIKAGDRIAVDDPLVTLESDKAIMDVPATHAGVIKEVKVQVGDKVSEGSPIVLIETDESAVDDNLRNSEHRQASVRERAQRTSNFHQPQANPIASIPLASADKQKPMSAPPAVAHPAGKPHASPLARRFARELGVDITRVEGGAPSGRILKADVERYVRAELLKTAQAAPEAARPAAQPGLPPWPKVDFAKFGEVEVKPLSRIRKISGLNLTRNWVMIPHVTHFDEADVTELETLRIEVNQGLAKDGSRVTILAFVLKACVAALKQFPEFNASLEGSDLILKKYFHIGFAVDTPEGLIVPVLRNADSKGVLQIAKEMAELGAAARAGKLKMSDLQGGCFTISSLGGIGGVGFTPIINAPEVAILGISRVTQRPTYVSGALVPRLILPVSLSYDHRVIDGAMAARFTSYLSTILADLRRALL